MQNNKIIITLAFILALCSIAYELLLANFLMVLTGSDVLWQCLTIGIYITALGVGTYFAGRIKRTDASSFLIKVELALSIVGMISTTLLMAGFILYRVHYTDQIFQLAKVAEVVNLTEGKMVYFGGFIAFTYILVVAIGFLSGFEIPLLIDMGQRSKEKKEIHKTLILCSSYIGSMAGALLFALWWQPEFDNIIIACLIGVINLFSCAVLILISPKASRSYSWVGIVAGVALCFVTLTQANRVGQLFLRTFYYYAENFLARPIALGEMPSFFALLPKVARYRSLYQYIDHVSVPELDTKGFPIPGTKDGFALFLNGHFQFYSETERYYHESMVHVPIILRQQIPQSVLVLGGGDGLIDRELLKYKQSIEHIKHIELDQQMLTLGRTHPELVSLNQGALLDKKVSMVVGDAMHFLRNTRQTFDAVFIDFPHPYNYDLAKLYSLEFYSWLARCLKPDGFVVVDVPIYSAEDIAKKDGQTYLRYNSIFFNTMRAAGFSSIFPFSVYITELAESGDTFIMLRKDKRPLDWHFKLEKTVPVTILDETNKQLLMKQIGQYPFKNGTEFIHSIFKPILFSFKDPRF